MSGSPFPMSPGTLSSFSTTVNTIFQACDHRATGAHDLGMLAMDERGWPYMIYDGTNMCDGLYPLSIEDLIEVLGQEGFLVTPK